MAVAEAYVEVREASGDAEQALKQLRPLADATFNRDVIVGLEAWIRGNSDPRPPARPPQRTRDLTEREREVLKCLVGGMNNREIAAKLVISRRTVEHHLEHIYGKLDVSSRTSAVACALTEDLVP